MAGHSKFSEVERLKGSLEIKGGATFSKFVNGITVAARPGEGRIEHLSEKHVYSPVWRVLKDVEHVAAQVLQQHEVPEGDDDTRNVDLNSKFPDEVFARLG